MKIRENFIMELIAYIIGIFVGVFIGMSIGMWNCEKEAVKNKAGYYHPETGEFTWRIK